MKIGDLIRDKDDGLIGIITKEPYIFYSYNRTPNGPNYVEVWWPSTNVRAPMHLSAFAEGKMEIIGKVNHA